MPSSETLKKWLKWAFKSKYSHRPFTIYRIMLWDHEQITTRHFGLTYIGETEITTVVLSHRVVVVIKLSRIYENTL